MRHSGFLLLGLMLFAGPSGAQSPNVLLIISDDLNTSIGPYLEVGNHTPSLDRLAQRGLMFSRAYCQYPLCGPSRASIMSGLYPEMTRMLENSELLGSYRRENPRLAGHPSIAGFFREQGYFTARVSKIFHMGVPGGIERGAAGGDDPDSWDYACNIMGPETLSPAILELLSPKNLHYGSNFARMILPDGAEETQTDHIAASQAIAILESRAAQVAQGARNMVKLKPEAPFFLAVGFVRPHVPLIAPESCFRPYPEGEIILPENAAGPDVPPEALQRSNDRIWGMDTEQQRKAIAGYYASVRFMDRQVGRLLDALERLGLAQNTIVVFLSDHGYNLGEHGCWSKVSLWEGSVRVPLLIAVPGYPDSHGRVDSAIVELIDLYPTLADLCGFSQSKPAVLQGRSHAGRFTGQLSGADDLESAAYTVSYSGTAFSLRTRRWRYNHWEKGAPGRQEELYDHEYDPDELVNLAGKAEYGGIVQMMRERLEQTRATAGFDE
jgi:iduronate 2-sulfatase